MTAHTPDSSAQHYVGFWKRFLATIVDTLLLLLVIYPPLLAIYGWEYFDPEKTGIIAGLPDFILSWIVPFFLVISFWSWKQATPGKMLIQAKIVDVRTGGKPTLMQWILRYVGYFISAIPLGLGYFWIAFDPRKQGWHDKIAGTVVVDAKE